MMTDRTAAESQHQTWLPGIPLPVLLTIATAALAYVAHVVAQHTIEIVRARRLVPLWDLVTHLGHGWLDYHLLATGQIHRLLLDLWLQGYWPPMLSIYMVPFYLVLGGGMTSGLWSGLVAFILAGLTGCAVLWRQWKQGAVLSASLFLALLMSSPFLLAYASVPMTEVLGALAQLLVLLTFVHYRRNPSPRAARLFAVSLTVLFFTKYNYFLLLAAPLVLHEWFERTSDWNAVRRLTSLSRWAWRVVSTPTGAFVSLYVAGLLLIVRSGGFDFQLLGRRISVHSIGNTGYVVLYLLLGRLWYLHRRGRIDWVRLTSADPRIRPLLLWFAAPVAVWLASPYPNHIRDVFNLVFNRPLGESTVRAGIAAYLDALRTAYFYNEWILACVVVAFGVATVRYRRQPPLMQLLIVAVPLQFAAIAFHHTRFPRFLLLMVVLLCLAAASEVGRWFMGSGRGRLAASLLAPLVVAVGVLAARDVVTQERFRAYAFENYTDNETLRAALDSIRAELNAGDRLAIVGHSNELSPGLFRWELGPPSGVPCFPFEVGGANGVALPLATRVLLLAPLDPGFAPLDVTSYYPAQRSAVLERVDRGELVFRREVPLPDTHIALWLYDRPSTSEPKAACR
ncbi:MAG: hypothetical protein NTV05_09525 [Acidobacteria bacterium]|nr:hypothetical protein [Acidobacteriota bacterium]